ncbi:MAG: hybrid sensor histidine kinase/response regulator, partial [Treponema sp.]|nr:hybrid sensor histidine kinase/response regulator [Treponema sp.]
MEVNSIDAGSRFLASTLHEVRTPIQTIISTVELLGETSLDKEQNEYVHQIEFSANVLLQLANDILDYTKIHSGDLKIENIPFDVVDLTEHVVDLVSIEAINKGLE